MTQVRPKSHIQIALQSIDAFLNDGTLDTSEINKMLATAMADGHIDDNEKRTLQSIFAHAAKSELSSEAKALIESLKLRHGLG
jgi:uncharacterized membrane protein YebE (DUF533 family)